MHKAKTLVYADTTITNLIINGTVTVPMTFAGSIDKDGYCEHSTYTDPWGTWKKVIVQGYIQISLFEYTAKIKLDADEIHLQPMTTCRLTDLTCMHPENGRTFWSYVPEHDCAFEQYGVLYNGIVNKITGHSNNQNETIYSLEADEATFAVRSRGYIGSCGHKIIRTEHPKIFVMGSGKDHLAVQGKPSPIDLDSALFVNVKFVYVNWKVKTNMKSLYTDLLMKRCETERETLKNSLILATLAPDHFAYKLMKGPGYMAAVAGEVVYVTKCIPMEVKFNETDHCFNELPVTRGDENYFLTPVTHILISKATQVPCDSLIQPTYFLENKWHKFEPERDDALPPTELKPMTNVTWNYNDPYGLATLGIYSEQRQKEMRDYMLFPMNQKGVVQGFVKGATGEIVHNQGHSLAGLLDESTINKIVESNWSRTWGKFTAIGTWGAGIIGLILTGQFFGYFINVIIRCIAIYRQHGWFPLMLGAFWVSLTGLFLISFWKRNNNNDNSNNNNGERSSLPLTQMPGGVRRMIWGSMDASDSDQPPNNAVNDEINITIDPKFKPRCHSTLHDDQNDSETPNGNPPPDPSERRAKFKPNKAHNTTQTHDEF